MTNVKIPWLLTKVSLWRRRRRRTYGTIRLSRCAAGKKPSLQDCSGLWNFGQLWYWKIMQCTYRRLQFPQWTIVVEARNKCWHLQLLAPKRPFAESGKVVTYQELKGNGRIDYSDILRNWICSLCTWQWCTYLIDSPCRLFWLGSCQG